MKLPCDLAQINADQLRDLTASLIHAVNQHAQQLWFRQLKIEKLTHEMATLKRWRFSRRSEQLDAVQRSLLEEYMVGLFSPRSRPPDRPVVRRDWRLARTPEKSRTVCLRDPCLVRASHPSYMCKTSGEGVDLKI